MDLLITVVSLKCEPALLNQRIPGALVSYVLIP